MVAYGAAAGMTLELVDTDAASVANTLHDGSATKYEAKSGDAGFAAARQAMKKKKAAPTDETEGEEAAVLSVGQRVKSKSTGKLGTIRFIGKIEPLPKGWWLGIELDDATGKNDGEVKGVRLFSCEPNHGAVMRPSAVEVIDNTVFECAAKGDAAGGDDDAEL